MPFRTSVIPIVTICDPQGALIWSNHPNPDYKPGTPVWEYASIQNRELVKDRLSRAAFLKELQEFDAVTDLDEHYHVWIWPIERAGLGVCLVGMRLPSEIALLTPRERDCLARLAVGTSANEIAHEFDVSVSTVHTYLKRAREKLGLPSLEHLIAFASRHLTPSEAITPPEVFNPPVDVD